MRTSRPAVVVFALVAGMVFCGGMRPAFAGTTCYVDDDAPADFATIQAAKALATADGQVLPSSFEVLA